MTLYILVDTKVFGGGGNLLSPSCTMRTSKVNHKHLTRSEFWSAWWCHWFGICVNKLWYVLRLQVLAIRPVTEATCQEHLPQATLQLGGSPWQPGRCAALHKWLHLLLQTRPVLQIQRQDFLGNSYSRLPLCYIIERDVPILLRTKCHDTTLQINEQSGSIRGGKFRDNVSDW